MTNLWNSLTRTARAFGPSPLVTWLSAQGTIELSGTTYFNGVSKAANFFVDGLMLDSESAVCVDLENHWQSPVWLAAVVASGSHIADRDSASVVVTFLDQIPSDRGNTTYVAISRHPFGVPDTDVPFDVVNGSLEVRNFGDYFPGPDSQDAVIYSGVDSQIATEDGQRAVDALFTEHHVSLGQRVALSGIGTLEQRIAWHFMAVVLGECSLVLGEAVYADSTALSAEKIDVSVSL